MKGLIFLSISIGLLFQQCVSDNSSKQKPSAAPENLIYTKHARCRMDCRHISEEEIQEILQSGKKNSRKSKPGDSPCPTTALEGLTSDNQEVRIIVAECEPIRKIVTVIDLRTDWECHCE